MAWSVPGSRRCVRLALTFRGFFPGTESLSSSVAITFCDSPNRDVELTRVAAASVVRAVVSFMVALGRRRCRDPGAEWECDNVEVRNTAAEELLVRNMVEKVTEVALQQ